MASLLLRRPLLSPLTLGLGFGLTTLYAAYSLQLHRPQRLLCDTSPTLSGSFRTYQQDAKVPVVKNGRPNPAAYKQISSGSIIGLMGGLAVSTFSKTLAFVFGLFVFGVQFAATKGYNIIPTSRLQKYFKSIDLRSALEDNVAFKLSFGATFMLAAFAEL
ncbi:MAG: Heme peroxidase [Lasallia pustulata]|uniref:Heme peroxidase n=1 Tax=Lasallia pustulata TaxID=136370 RepID=A0A5M8PS22_9LECA|nr:MAG: Heme peroxidase [Lasallia pustulata]